jgi:hypothetical protein
MMPTPVITTPTAADKDIKIAAADSSFAENLEDLTLSDVSGV